MKWASERWATAATARTSSGSAYARSMASRARRRRRFRSSTSRLMVQRYAITRPDLVGPRSGTSPKWRMIARRRVYRTAVSAIEDRPAEVVPQPFVVEHELADRLRELVALPSTLESPC